MATYQYEDEFVSGGKADQAQKLIITYTPGYELYITKTDSEGVEYNIAIPPQLAQFLINSLSVHKQ